MITWGDLYTVLSALVPLYVAMFLAYGSVRWWKIFTPVQCSGINRFVAVFAVPLLSFHFISTNNPYQMDGLFILADTISKLAVLFLLALWARFSRHGSLDWMITIFAVATLPNTLVMGIPMLKAMYGSFYGGLMVQLVVLQCIIWYTLMLFLFEYRAAASLLRQQFPDTAASIVSFKVDSDVVSLDGRDPLQTIADVGDDGKIRVTIRRSTSSRSLQAFNHCNYPFNSPRMSIDPSSKAITPRPSNLTGAEIYSVYSSRNNTPRECYYNSSGGWAGNLPLDGGGGIGHPSAAAMMAGGGGGGNRPSSPTRPSNFTCSDVYSVQSSRGPTPRASNANNEDRGVVHSPRLPPPPSAAAAAYRIPSAAASLEAVIINPAGLQPIKQSQSGGGHGVKKLNHTEDYHDGSNVIHIHGGGGPEYQKTGTETANGELHDPLNPAAAMAATPHLGGEDFSFGSRGRFPAAAEAAEKQRQSMSRSSTGFQSPTTGKNPPLPPAPPGLVPATELPAAPVLAKLILRMVCRKLLQNPNTYSSLVGLIWSLIAFRWNIAMPKIISNSISLVSDAGLGMAMFSLGLFMALQPKLIACGTGLAVFAMAIRFLTGPAVMAASSIAVGLRGVDLHAAIVQAALPQGIVPFVFAREYDLHPDILSTAVIFGMLVALPTTILYYVLLGL